MEDQCVSCKQTIPPHFHHKGIKNCLTCMAIKISLSQQVKPEPFEKEQISECVICQQKIPIGLPRSPLCEECLHVVEASTGNTYFEFYRNYSQPWLVKSGGLIMGPLSSQQVEDKIRNKEVGLFDVIQRPFGRWIYAREEKTFEKVIEEVRSRPAGREDTVALGATDATAVTMVGEVEDTLSGARAVEPLNNEDVALTTERFEQASRPASAFRTFLLFGFLLFLAVSVLAILTFQSSNSKFNDEEGKKIVQTARDALDAGDFHSARVAYRRAMSATDLDPDNTLHYAAILIEDGFLTEAERVLKQVSGKQLTETERVRHRLLSGIKALSSGDFQQAQDEIEQSLKIDKNSTLAALNLANVHLLKGDPEKAVELLFAHSPVSDKEFYNFLLLDAVAAKYRENGSLSSASRAIEKVGSTSPPQPYAAESTLLLAFLQLKLGEKSNARAEVNKLLDAEPEVTEFSVPNLYLFRKRTHWQNLEGYCKELSEVLELWNLNIYCLLRTGETLRAKDVAQEAFLKRSDPSTAAFFAISLLKVGKHDEALSTIKGKSLYSPFERWVMATICEAHKDTECVQDEVSKLLELTPSSPYAISQKLRGAIGKDNREAQRWLEIGRERAWYYRPVRQLELGQRPL